MSDMFSRISEILNNPEASRKIREIAASMAQGGGSGSGGETSPSLPSDSEALPLPGDASEGGGIADLVKNLGNLSSTGEVSGAHSRDLALLNAVKPYLRQSRAGKIDNAIKAIRVIDMLSGMR